MDKNTLILTKTKFLKNYKIENINENVIQKILSISKNHNQKIQNNINVIIPFLNFFYFAQNKTLSYINLSDKKTYEDFFIFLKFLNEEYILLNKNTLSRYKRAFEIIVEDLKKEFNIKNIKEKDFYPKLLNSNKVDFYNNFHILDNKNESSLFLNLTHLYPLFSFKDLDKIKQKGEEFSSIYSIKLLKTSFPILKEFNQYIIKNVTKKEELKIESKATNLLNNFCRQFFYDAQNKNYCLYTRIRNWNYFKKVFNFLFYQTNLINISDDNYPLAPSREKEQNLINIKQQNGINYKNKLITDIPLTLNDNEAIELLFFKIKNDIKIVNVWFNEYLEKFKKNYNNPKYNFNESDFNVESRKLKRKYQLDCLKKAAFNSGIPCFSTLEYFIFALINEHPQITDSFLINFNLYDDNDRLIGIKETDTGVYLTGQKLRKGSKLAEQNILLNDKSKELIYLLINSTKMLREYLKKQNNNEWRKLFIGLSQGCNNFNPKSMKKTFVPAPSNSHNSIFREREKYFSSLNENIDSKKFVYNLTPTKFRASKGVETYLNTESTTEMSKILGHEKYRPELLSRYLPKIILDFFQTRWIRIFQKGIICEALKDSEYLYKATKFKSLEELNLFLEKHSLNNFEKVNLKNNKEIIISINENILTALLSLEKAVDLNTSKSNSKAIYWADFSKRLQFEIENKNENIVFLPILNKAKNNINHEVFKDIINE